MRLDSVGKRYGVRQPWVVRGMSADVPPGRLIRVEGRNGSGKSTLLRVVARVTAASEGRVTGRPAVIGYVPERFPGRLPFSGREYLRHMARVHGLRADAGHRQVERRARFRGGGGPVIALLRYQAAILLRSHRWIFPLMAYGLLIAVGAAGSTSLAETLDWSGAMLVPVTAFLTRAVLAAQTDAARACVGAAAGPARAQLATLFVPLGGGALLGVAAVVFGVLTAEPASGLASPAGSLADKVTDAGHHPGIVVIGACCLLAAAWGVSVFAATRRDSWSVHSE